MKDFFSTLSLRFDRSFSKDLFRQVIWLIGIMAIVYIILAGLSYVSALYTPGGENSQGRWYDILLVLIDPGSGSDSMTSPFTILCAVLGLIIFSGMLISVISNVLERRVESYNNGETDYNISDHVVILGFNESIPSLLREINKTHYGFILLMCEKETSKVRDWIHAHLDESNEKDKRIEKNLIVLNGVRNADDDIDRLKLSNNVRKIYIIGEENEPAHDAISMECVKSLAPKVDSKNIIKCHVQLNSDTMFTICQKVKLDRYGSLDLQPFCFNEIWAHKALAVTPGDGYIPLDGQGITKDSDKHVHLIIVGMNPLSWSLAVNAAHILHFPNFVEGNFDTCSMITIIDEEATMKGQAFRSRYNHLFNLARWRAINSNQCAETDKYWIDPLADADSISPYKHLGPTNFMDIQWEFIEGSVYDEYIMNYIEASSINERTMTTVAICNEDSDENISICLSLPDRARTESNEILVRQNESDLLIDSLLQKAYGFDKIRAFGMMSECYKENINSDKYGKLINACYKEGGCKFDGSKEENEEIEKAWSKCEPIDKCSSNYCANMLFVKLRFLGLDTTKVLTQQEIKEATSEVNHDIIQKTEHNRWNTERLLLATRPLYKEELDEWCNVWLKVKNKNERKKEKKEHQKALMRHVDICSNDQLVKFDPEVVSFDTTINDCLYKLYEYFLKK